MKADLTRNTFQSANNFTRVLMQQGRVQLDADWNEQAAILLHYLQSLAADLIGPHGGPSSNLGFQIVGGADPAYFAISPGHYYVDGILCEVQSPSAPVALTKPDVNKHSFQVPNAATADFKAGAIILVTAEGATALAKITNVDPSGVITLDNTNPDVKSVLEAKNPKAYTQFVRFDTQPDYPVSATNKLANGSFWAYLDVWERLITAVEDDSIREVALNGADTAARAKVTCQVKTMAMPAGTPDCMTSLELQNQLQPGNRGRLTAQAKQTSPSTDPCVIAPDASYRGPENQLYRVEIHSGVIQDGVANKLTPTFKWSRENGSVVFPIVSPPSGGSGSTVTVVLESLGRDDRFGLREGDWVELLDDNYVLQNIPGNLLSVQSIDSGKLSVTLAGTVPAGLDPTKHPLLRRWDQTFGDPAQGGLQTASDSAASLVEGAWLNLENSIQIMFQTPDQGGAKSQYRTGDYWLLPARTATGDILWPSDANGPLAMPPDGIDHHYAPLAGIKVDGNGVEVNLSCQKEFPQLTQVKSA